MLPVSKQNLRDDVDGLGVLCASAADWFTQSRGVSVLPDVIEKDFWVTELLRQLSQVSTVAHAAPVKGQYPAQVRAIFKGGTSLSKAYGIIQRFSEDADVYLSMGKFPGSRPKGMADSPETPEFAIGNARIDTIMKSIAIQIGEPLALTPEAQGNATSGVKRTYGYSYPRSSSATQADSGLKPFVQLDLVRMGTPTPNASREIGSMLAEYVRDEQPDVLNDFTEFASFRIDVLAPERTLVDKLCIIDNLSARVQTGEYQLRWQARHYYDVALLLSTPSVIDCLQSQPGMVEQYANDAHTDSKKFRRSASVRPSDGFATSLAFSDPKVVAHAKQEYEREMAKLALAPFPDFDEVIATVHRNAELL